MGLVRHRDKSKEKKKPILFIVNGKIFDENAYSVTLYINISVKFSQLIGLGKSLSPTQKNTS